MTLYIANQYVLEELELCFLKKQRKKEGRILDKWILLGQQSPVH